MRCRLPLGLLALFVLPPVMAADDPPKGSDLFPLAVGNRWTYRIEGQEDKLVVSCGPAEKLGEHRSYRVEVKLRDRVISTEHLSVRKDDGAYRHRSDGMDIEPPLRICKFPPIKGDAWKAEYKMADKKVSIEYATDEEEISVLGAKYKTIVVRGTVVAGGGMKHTCWYAPKVGLVRQVVEDGDNTIVLELEKFDKFTFKKP